MSYETYAEYSDAIPDWLGAVPQHWQRMPLKRKFRLVNGSTPQASEPDYWDGEIVWITPADFRTSSAGYLEASGRKITLQGLNSCGTSLVPKNSIVLTTRAPIGGVAQVTAEFCTNQGCKSLALDAAGIWERFVYFVLDVSGPQLNALGLGSTFMELSTDDLGMYRFPLPPLPEQQQIAAFLDWKTGQIDALMARKKELLEKLKEKRLAVITQAVTRGLNPAAPLRDSGIPWLGHVPAHWEARRLKFAVTLRNEKIEAEDSHLDYMGLEHIESWTGKRIEDESAASEGIATRFVKDDVLFGKLRPYLAKVYLAEKEGMATPEALILTSAEVLDPKFLKYLLISDKFIDAVSGTTYGAKMPRANWDAIGSLPILLPTRNEQQQIAAFLDWKTGQIDALTSKIEVAIARLTEYRTALITAATTGKIDVRGVKIPQPEQP